MPNPTTLSRAFLLNWFELLRPDICQHLMGFSWQICYQGKLKLLVLSDKEFLFPEWIWSILADLLGKPILSGGGEYFRFEQYLLALEKEYGCSQSFSLFVGNLESCGEENRDLRLARTK